MRCTGRELAVAVGLSLVLAACKGDTGPQGPAGPPGPAGQAAGGASGQSNLAINPTAARITADNHLQVDYTVTLAGAAPSTNDITTNWTGAYLGTDAASGLQAWQNVTLNPTAATGAAGTTNQPSTDRGGTTENLGGGNFRYTFGSTVPTDAPRTATWRIGVYAQRPLPGIANPAEAPDYDVANGIIDFVPSGGGNAQGRELVSTQACNGCHGILQAHGGFRRDVRLCQTCHTTQLFDPDTHDPADPTQMNPLDLGRLVHRIHRGEDLPTVVAAAAKNDTSYKYDVIGFRNSDNVYGAVVPNPNPAAAGTTPAVTSGVAFPQDLRNCAVCHAAQKDAQGNAVSGGEGAQSSDWKTAVARRTCQGCHDSSWFKDANPPAYHVVHQQASNPPVKAGTNPTTPAGTTPAGLPLTDDTSCKTCHSETLMAQHHTAPTLSGSFNPITLKINSAKASGGTLTVNFSATNKDGSPVAPLSSLSTLSVVASGPTTDYQVKVPPPPPVTVNAITAATSSNTTPGTWDVKLQLPQDASGTWAVGMEARRTNVALTTSERKLGNVSSTATFTDFAPVNPVAYFNPSGSGTVVKRRQVVAQENCNACHQILSVHGGLRHTPEYCVLCHAPNATDAPGAGGTTPATGRPGDASATLDKLPARSIHLKVMIHQIHTGEALEVTKPFVIYGFQNSVNFFDEVRFPGTRARCSMCHVDSTYTVDAIPDTAQPTHSMQIGPATMAPGSSNTVTTGGAVADVQPATAACISCHDALDAHAHVQAMTQPPAPGADAVETCAVCHGESADFAVSRVHARFTR